MIDKSLIKEKRISGENAFSLLSKVLEAAILIEIGLGVAYMILKTTLFDLEIPKETETTYLTVFFATAVLKLIAVMVYNYRRDKLKTSLPYIIMALLIAATYCISGITLISKMDDAGVNRYSFLYFIAIAIIGTIGSEYVRVIGVHVAVLSFMLVITISAAINGVIENYIYLHGWDVRSSWGIIYPTNMASYFVYLCIFFWIAYRKKIDLWFLIPGAVSFAIARYVADSATSSIVMLAFMGCVVLNSFLQNNDKKGLRDAVGIVASSAFPLFSVIMNFLVLLYNKGLPLIAIVNKHMHGRIALAAAAYEKYGLSLFGNPLPQYGNGGGMITASASSSYYNYVDITYNLIPLNYGIVVFLMINVLWVMMIRRAVKLNDYRLALGMTLIAIHSMSEQHFIEPNYNILILMPVSILMTKQVTAFGVSDNSGINTQSNQFKIKKLTIEICASAAVVLLWSFYAFLPWLRTIVTWTGVNKSSEGHLKAFIIIAVCTIVLITMAYLIYKLIDSIKEKHEKINIYIAAVICFVIAAGAPINYMDTIIEKIRHDETAFVAEDKEAIEIIKKTKNNRLYAEDLPEVYRRVYGGINTSIFSGEELAHYDNVTIITDKDDDWIIPFKLGFLYSPISENHAIYTNNKAVIESMSEEGYHFTSYNSEVKNISMLVMAILNGSTMTDSGAVVVYRGAGALGTGDTISLNGGQYTITYDLSVKKNLVLKHNANKKDSNDDVCKLEITSWWGENTLGEKMVKWSDFDKNGNLHAELIINIEDSIAVNISVLPLGVKKVEVKGLSYQKTPEYDVHFMLDKKHRRICDEYYDLAGNPVMAWNSFFAVKREFDWKDRVVREEYLDTKGSMVNRSDGYAYVITKYDKENNPERTYYNKDNIEVFLDN